VLAGIVLPLMWLQGSELVWPAASAIRQAARQRAHVETWEAGWHMTNLSNGQYVFHARCHVACAHVRSTRGKRMGA
jgi:hypothetical protein